MVQSGLLLCDVCMCVYVCVSYGRLQQHGRVQPGLQLDDGLPPDIQVADVAHQPFTKAVFDSTVLHRTIRGKRIVDKLRPPPTSTRSTTHPCVCVSACARAILRGEVDEKKKTSCWMKDACGTSQSSMTPTVVSLMEQTP